MFAVSYLVRNSSPSVFVYGILGWVIAYFTSGIWLNHFRCPRCGRLYAPNPTIGARAIIAGLPRMRCLDVLSIQNAFCGETETLPPRKSYSRRGVPQARARRYADSAPRDAHIGWTPYGLEPGAASWHNRLPLEIKYDRPRAD